MCFANTILGVSLKRIFAQSLYVGLGKAFGSIVKRERLKKIALSGDIQLSTPKLKKHFQEAHLA